MIKSALMMINLMLDGDAVLNPVYEGISTVGPIAISVVLVLSLFYGIFLGVKYAKSESADQKANTLKTLVNFVIGAVIVLVLISIIYAIRGPIADFINGE